MVNLRAIICFESHVDKERVTWGYQLVSTYLLWSCNFLGLPLLRGLGLVEPVGAPSDGVQRGFLTIPGGSLATGGIDRYRLWRLWRHPKNRALIKKKLDFKLI